MSSHPYLQRHEHTPGHILLVLIAAVFLAVALVLVIAGPTAPALHPADITTPSTTPPVIYEPDPAP